MYVVMRNNDCIRARSCAADAILGVRMILTASRGICPFKGGFNCSMHALLGSVITAASVADLALAFIVALFFERVLTCVEKHTRKVRSHVIWRSCASVNAGRCQELYF